MKSVHAWLDEYGESHRNPLNKRIHWICVPAIMLSILGLFWAINTPVAFQKIGGVWLNWGSIVAVLACLYYLILSPKLAIGMLFPVAAMLGIVYMIAIPFALPIWLISLIIFTIAWVFQFYGHKVEGAKPSFLKDIQFLLIGPLWLLSFIYKRIGISY